MIKLDLHTHSQASHDGGLSLENYVQLIVDNVIDVIAITDHGDVSFAKRVAKDPRIKGNVIVGQEVMTTEGEIIGLFLKNKIEDGKSARETVDAIKNQEGFVIVPHPQDPYRSGISFEVLEEIADATDGIEVQNGRQLKSPAPELRHWALQNNILPIASSDAHTKLGVGCTFTVANGVPGNAADLKQILADNSRTVFERPPMLTYLAPKFNKLKKILGIGVVS